VKGSKKRTLTRMRSQKKEKNPKKKNPKKRLERRISLSSLVKSGAT